MQYVLNEKVIFFPEKNLLRSICEASTEVHLNSPVSRCLLLLAQNYEQTVAQKDFFSFVWGEQGNQLPTNTLYQNISLLRRALTLASTSLNESVITVPRVGFKLNSEVSVRELSEEEASALIAHIKNEDQSSKVLSVTGMDVSKLIMQKRTVNIRVYSIITLITVMLWGVYSYEKDRVYQSIFKDYVFIEKINECEVYTDAEEKEDVLSIKLLLDRVSFICFENKYLYYSKANNNRVSIMSCSQKLPGKSECTTHIYWDEKNELP